MVEVIIFLVVKELWSSRHRISRTANDTQSYWKKFVKNKGSRLNIFLFSFLIFIFFLIYFLLFLELGLELEWQDHTVTQQVTSDDTVTSHMIHRRM